uniref:Estrogen receptor n=1 Tax=Magallana gigas TaxID=29159 RepID=K1QUU5_MAGGI
MEAKYHDQQFEDALTVIQGLSDPGGTVCRILRESSAAASATGDEAESMSGESIEKLVPKEESHGSHHSPGMVPQGSFLSMPYMMHNQVPSSTTLEFRDHDGRILPLLDPSLSFADGRKLKHGAVSAHGPNKLCQVCSDNASGFHYGVWSCEGCKAFFKRSIQGPVDYVCPATNTCTIDKHRRKSCQACRLRKCYEVGMNKGSQRKERKGSISMSKPAATKRSRADSSDNTVNSTSGSPNPAKSARKSQTVTILQALNKAALPVLESHHNHGQPPTKVHLLNSLVKLAERELVHLINWAKNVPGYTDLSLSDQVHLIECCWMELLLLNCAFRSIEHGGKSLAFAPDLVLDRSSWSTVEMTEIFEQVAAVSEQMMQNHLHKDELLLLQAMVLVNAEVRRLASYNQIFNMQQSLLDAIVDTAQKYHPDNVRHVPAVLLLLTHIRQAGERGIAFFQRLKSEGVVTFCDLLKEMLDAQDFLEKKSSNEGD